MQIAQPAQHGGPGSFDPGSIGPGSFGPSGSGGVDNVGGRSGGHSQLYLSHESYQEHRSSDLGNAAAKEAEPINYFRIRDMSINSPTIKFETKEEQE